MVVVILKIFLVFLRGRVGDKYMGKYLKYLKYLY